MVPGGSCEGIFILHLLPKECWDWMKITKMKIPHPHAQTDPMEGAAL